MQRRIRVRTGIQKLWREIRHQRILLRLTPTRRPIKGSWPSLVTGAGGRYAEQLHRLPTQERGDPICSDRGSTCSGSSGHPSAGFEAAMFRAGDRATICRLHQQECLLPRSGYGVPSVDDQTGHREARLVPELTK